MSGRRTQLVHIPAEDLQRPNGRFVGNAVAGFATFYIQSTGWFKIPPGRLELARLYGGASSFPNQESLTTVRPYVEFYLDVPTVNHPNRVRGFVAVNASQGMVFTFGFFGTRYS